MNKKTTNTRMAFASTELVVACTLLAVAISVIAMLAVKTTRLWQDSRHQQIAIEELSWEIDHLTRLNPEARLPAMENLEPSQLVKSISPNASITASWCDETKTAIALQLDWNTSQPKAPVKLIGWMEPWMGEEDQ